MGRLAFGSAENRAPFVGEYRDSRLRKFENNASNRPRQAVGRRIAIAPTEVENRTFLSLPPLSAIVVSRCAPVR